ncbi:MAG TPA: hydrogenase maturation protease [bacterium]|nr:hydrogenase maturation protease [bacterium]
MSDKQDDIKTLIIGMGNIIMSDDGVGIRIARVLSDRLSGKQDVDVRETPLTGMNLVTMIEGYETAIIIDAIKTVEPAPGVLHKFDLDELALTMHITSPHGTNLYTAVELGRRCGLKMPRKITIFGIEIEDATVFSEECTPVIESRLSAIADEIMKQL